MKRESFHEYIVKKKLGKLYSLLFSVLVITALSCSKDDGDVNTDNTNIPQDQENEYKCKGQGCNTTVRDIDQLDNDGLCSSCSKGADDTSKDKNKKKTKKTQKRRQKNIITGFTSIAKSTFDASKGVQVKLGFKNTKKTNCNIYICSGSVVDFTGDSIVNAANEGCLGGGGVDGAITSAGGKPLADLRKVLPTITGKPNIRCLTGSAVSTPSGKGVAVTGKDKPSKLKCKNVIHAVGPDKSKVKDSNEFYKLLEGAYKASISESQKLGDKSLAFSLISSSIFRGDEPLDDVLSASIEYVCNNAEDNMDIYMVAFIDPGKGKQSHDEINTLVQEAKIMIKTS